MNLKAYMDWRNFQHIKDLKIGDKLRLTKNPGYKFPKIGDYVYVYSLLDKDYTEDEAVRISVTGEAIRKNDFTTIFLDQDDNEILEYAMDSRYFERVEE